jgi:hypothetical protein
VDWALCADVLPNIKQHAAKDMVYLTFSLSLHFFPRSRSNKQIDILFCCCWHKHDKIEMEWSFFEMLGSVAYCIDITTIFGCTDCWFCPCLAWYTYSIHTIQHNLTLTWSLTRVKWYTYFDHWPFFWNEWIQRSGRVSTLQIDWIYAIIHSFCIVLWDRKLLYVQGQECKMKIRVLFSLFN